MLLGLTMKAQNTWTVDNNGGGQFTDLQTAIDDVSVVDGDTLLISGSLTSYGDITLNKSLTLIGPGHHPDKDLAFIAEISNISFDEKLDAFNNPLNNCNNSNLIGMKIRKIIMVLPFFRPLLSFFKVNFLFLLNQKKRTRLC